MRVPCDLKLRVRMKVPLSILGFVGFLSILVFRFAAQSQDLMCANEPTSFPTIHYNSHAIYQIESFVTIQHVNREVRYDEHLLSNNNNKALNVKEQIVKTIEVNLKERQPKMLNFI